MSAVVPVAFFAYNRPMHTRRALEALAKCRRVEQCEFHFFADGPRTDAAAAQVEETRRVLREWAPALRARIVEQPANLGLARSIVSGVSELCARHGRVIVVEDDLVVSRDFLHYMIESLDRYQDDARVMQVAGFTLSPPASLDTDVFLLPVTTTWGWGTWQRAWEAFSWAPDDLALARGDDPWRRLFDLDGSCNFSSMLEDRLAGRNDSWGILWWYAVSRRRGLVAYPAQSLVWNGGFDGSGVHCGDGDVFNSGETFDSGISAMPDLPRFPAETRYDPRHLTQLEDFFRSRTAAGAAPGRVGYVGRVLRSLATRLRAAI